VSLFTPPEPSTRAFRDERMPRGLRVGWSLLVLALVATVALSFVPAPYVIQEPGPVYDTLGTVEVDDETVDLVEIASETYPTTGSLSMLTVNIVGSRATRPSWIEVAVAWFDPSRSVVPLDSVYPEGRTLEQSRESNQIDMVNSQNDAIAAALLELGQDIPSTLTIEGVVEGSPAEGHVQRGDRLVSINGRPFADVPALREAVAENGTDAPVELVVIRAGEEMTVEVTPHLSDGPNPAPILGVTISVEYEFPVDIEIQLENVGGPSAGMMFALAIIDKLTPGAMADGESIAGTGTITRDGDVGPIGGIRQKLYGALNAGATWFLAPKANCDEVVGHVPEGLEVFAVSTLEEARAAVEAAANGDRAGLPSCD
jgi:PDZ domain-containing protein